MYYVTPKIVRLRKCRIPGCQAQTSNEWCAKCVARAREARKEQHMGSAVEFLDAHDVTVDEALAYATLEDVVINGSYEPPTSEGFLHARR